MRVYVGSLGCKLNQSEMDALAERLAAAGHQVVATPGEAETCVLNTCAVTHVAAQKSRQALRRLHRDNPDARLVVTGCYAELSPDELRDLPGVVLLAGNRDKDNLPALIDRPDRLAPSTPAAAPRTRALVKIQDGCDNACTYCLIHVARGPQRSRPAAHVLDEVRARVAAGYQEVVLTGVHVGAYGRDGNEPGAGGDLWALVASILRETRIARLRLSSVEPWDLPDGALALWRDPRLCRHLHLPLQSGAAATQRRMGRHGDPDHFARLVAAARAAVPGLAVTTDLIVGFPGETEAEFAESLAFVERMAFARLHVFPYSARAGTPAAVMAGQVPPEVKAERARLARDLGAAGALAFRRQLLGATVQVLWETRHEDRGWSGLTDNYQRVEAASDADLRNTLSPVRLTGLTPAGLRGEIIG